MAVGATGDPRWAYEYGRITGREARAVGVHLNFAPVLDVNTNPETPVIGTRAFGGDPGMVGRWVVWYRAHGQAGLEKKHSHYSADFKLSVLQHMWCNSLSYRQTAALFNIRNAAAVTDWDRCWRNGGLDALQSRPRGRPKKMSISPPLPPASSDDDEARSREELVAELNQLRMENAYLKKLQALVQTPRPSATRKKRK